MPRKGISYEQVAKACTDLEKSQSLSVRAIQARTGGSMTTVLKHYRRWQRERSGSQDAQPAISERLRNALLNELEEAAAQSRQGAQRQLQEAQQKLAKLQTAGEAKQRLLTQRLQRADQQLKHQGRRLRDAEQQAAAAEQGLRSARTRLGEQQAALRKEQQLRRIKEQGLQQMQALKEAAEERLLEQEQRLRALEEQLQDPQPAKKAAPPKKKGKKNQQSLFDF